MLLPTEPLWSCCRSSACTPQNLLCSVQIDARVGVAADVLQAMLPDEADAFDFAFIGAAVTHVTACKPANSHQTPHATMLLRPRDVSL